MVKCRVFFIYRREALWGRVIHFYVADTFVTTIKWSWRFLLSIPSRYIFNLLSSSKVTKSPISHSVDKHNFFSADDIGMKKKVLCLTLVCHICYHNVSATWITSLGIICFSIESLSDITSYFSIYPSIHFSLHSIRVPPPQSDDVSYVMWKKGLISWRAFATNQMEWRRCALDYRSTFPRLKSISGWVLYQTAFYHISLEIEPLNQFTKSCLSSVAKFWFGNIH